MDKALFCYLYRIIMADKLLISEEKLLEELRDPARRRMAFEKVVRLYNRKLYWQIRRMVLSHDDTDDLLQNTFMKAWSALDGFRGEAKLSTWLYRIAMYESLNFLKKKKIEDDMSISITDENSYLLDNLTGDVYFDGDEAEIAFQKAILELPDKQRLVFNLRYYDEMPYEKMAEITGTSEGALKASYHHAVKKLERFLSPDD